MPTSSKIYLFRRENGYYYIGYTLGNKVRWKSTHSKCKTDALRVLSEFKTTPEETLHTPLLSSFTDDFLAFSGKTYCKSTIEIFRIALGHLKIITGDITLEGITPKHVDLYKTKRISEVAPTTVNVELRQLRSAFNYAVRWQLIDNNPFSKVKLCGVPERVPIFLTREDFQKLISTIKEGWLKEIIILAVLTGMRRGEIINLRWGDIDFKRKTIKIQSSKSFHVKQGKTRTIPLSESANYLLLQRKNCQSSEYVFNNKEEKRSAWYTAYKFKEYVHKLGLNEKLHFHSLRHTFASWLVQDGVSLYEVQKLLGHSNISVTQVYAHLQPERLHGTVNRIMLG